MPDRPAGFRRFPVAPGAWACAVAPNSERQTETAAAKIRARPIRCTSNSSTSHQTVSPTILETSSESTTRLRRDMLYTVLIDGGLFLRRHLVTQEDRAFLADGTHHVVHELVAERRQLERRPPRGSRPTPAPAPRSSSARWPRPMTSHSTLVCVTSQMARRSLTFGSDSPRSHFRRAPSDRSISRASALVFPYESMT